MPKDKLPFWKAEVYEDEFMSLGLSYVGMELKTCCKDVEFDVRPISKEEYDLLAPDEVFYVIYFVNKEGTGMPVIPLLCDDFAKLIWEYLKELHESTGTLATLNAMNEGKYE